MIGGFEDWANFGIAGVVIFSLVITIRFGLEKFEAVVNQFSKDFRELRQEHREDRKDWHEAMMHKEEIDRQSQERRDLALTQALTELKDAITKQNNRHRFSDNKN